MSNIDQRDKLVFYIEKGDYEIPSYLSPQLVDLIKHMMDPDPKTRYYLADVINHAWFNSSPSFQTLLGGINYFEMKYPIDSRILNICDSYGFDKDKVKVALEQNKYNEYSTVYRLCVNKIVNAGMSSISDLSSNEFKGYIEDKNNILDEEEQHNKQEKFDKEIQEMKTILNNQEKQLINFEEEAMKALNEITTEYINIQKEEIEKEKKALAEESIIIPTNESNNSSASHKNLHKVVEPDYAVLPHIVISNARTIDRFESLYIERRDLSESPCGHNRDSFPDISIRGSGYPYGNYRIIDLKKKTKRGRSEMVVSTNIRRFRQYYNKEYDLKREEYLKRENPKRRKAITKRNEVEEAVRIYKKSIEVEEVKESDGESFSLNSFSSSFNGDLKKDDLFDFTEEEENKKEQEEEEKLNIDNETQKENSIQDKNITECNNKENSSTNNMKELMYDNCEVNSKTIQEHESLFVEHKDNLYNTNSILKPSFDNNSTKKKNLIEGYTQTQSRMYSDNHKDNVLTEKIWYYQLNLDRNLGKTNPLSEDDLADFVALQKTKASSPNSWTLDVKDLNAETLDLSVKNPNKKEEKHLREPAEIIKEMRELNKQAEELLKGM